jgi:hypothetical protein
MYPVAPACLILFVKRISDDPFLMLLIRNSSCAQELALINENTQSGRRMIV